MTRLSNVELMLLEIIHQQEEICGYEIGKLVDERDYREWADIGTTSIYKGLDKLQNKGLLCSRIDEGKKGRGPLPRKFKLTDKGKTVLKNELLKGLSFTREKDRKFDLAFSAIGVLGKREVIEALKTRKFFLLKTAEGVQEKFEFIGGDKLPINIKALFDHSLYLIKCEVTFVENLIMALEKEHNIPPADI